MEQQAYRDRIVNVQNSKLGVSRVIGAVFKWGRTAVRSAAASVWLGFQIFAECAAGAHR